jgi:hypothetical protein
MDDFSHLLNWTLLDGSHDFPGPDGGTCINEAAIIAAGFAYKKVRHVRDLPPCFCPVIGAFSVWLNDSIYDKDLRNALLMPFVTRLSGTRGGPQDEAARLEVLRERLAELLPDRSRRRRFTHRHQEHLLLGDMVGPWTARRFSIRSASNVREMIRIAEFICEGISAAERGGFHRRMAQALGAMLAIGPQPTAAETRLVFARMEAVKALALHEAAVP